MQFGYDADRRSNQLLPNEEESAVVMWMFAEASSSALCVAASPPWEENLKSELFFPRGSVRLSQFEGLSQFERLAADE